MNRLKRASGFTLVEVLVAMTLLAMLMLALGSTLRTVAQVEIRIDSRNATIETMTSVSDLLRQTMESISARRNKSIVAGQPDAVQFMGASDRVHWVGIMPARHGAGGRYGFGLMLVTENNNAKLVLKYSPAFENIQFEDLDRTEGRVLAEYVSEFIIEYYVEEVDAEGWTDTWTKTDKVPSAMRIRLTTESGQWPEFVVRIRPLAPSDRSRSIFTMGGE